MIMAFGITMPGVPFIYYGNEIGMRELADMPQFEGAYKPRAGARTPMQWTLGKNRGFSTADFSRLYLPVDTSNDAPNVESEQKDATSLLNRVKKLIQLKRTEPALAAYAEFIPLYAKENTYPFVYARASGKDVLLVIINPAEKAAAAEFQMNVPYTKLQLLAGKKLHITKKDAMVRLDAPGIAYAVYKMN
jgi:maltose alpha-D-glucosyltransferase/alpha-amylase